MLRHKALPLPFRRPEFSWENRDLHCGETGVPSWMSRLPSTLYTRLPSAPALGTLAMTTIIAISHHKANDVSCKGQKMELLIS